MLSEIKNNFSGKISGNSENYPQNITKVFERNSTTLRKILLTFKNRN